MNFKINGATTKEFASSVFNNFLEKNNGKLNWNIQDYSFSWDQEFNEFIAGNFSEKDWDTQMENEKGVLYAWYVEASQEIDRLIETWILGQQ